MKTYPLLQSQLGVFMECMRHPESKQYNLPSISTFTKPSRNILRHVRMRFRLNMNISSVRESWIFIGQIELISYFLSMMLHKSKFLSKFAE